MLISSPCPTHEDEPAEWLERRRVEPNQIVELMPHRSPLIALVLTGLVRIEAPGPARIVPAGHAIVTPAPGLTRLTSLRPSTLVLTEADGIAAGPDDLLPISPTLTAILQSDYPVFETRHGRSILVEDLQRSRPVRCGVRMPTDPRAQRVAEAIFADPADPRSLDEFAARSGASRRTLLRLFVTGTGMTFRQFRRHARICCALTRFADGEAIQDVALAVGYESAPAFIAAFKAVTGTTPGSLRRPGSVSPPVASSGQVHQERKPVLI